ncbi:hypothetical protein BX600DRAFT_125551 [Xylariales sp. PMI_506]|nr:hypothetical protein BX600DRAFT_125551 [Xylariales sp. PMI_506]
MQSCVSNHCILKASLSIFFFSLGANHPLPLLTPSFTPTSTPLFFTFFPLMLLFSTPPDSCVTFNKFSSCMRRRRRKCAAQRRKGEKGRGERGKSWAAFLGSGRSSLLKTVGSFQYVDSWTNNLTIRPGPPCIVHSAMYAACDCNDHILEFTPVCTLGLPMQGRRIGSGLSLHSTRASETSLKMDTGVRAASGSSRPFLSHVSPLRFLMRVVGSPAPTGNFSESCSSHPGQSFGFSSKIVPSSAGDVTLDLLATPPALSQPRERAACSI